jgi:Signal transduction histidine kinase
MLEGVRALIPEDPAAAQTQLARVLQSLNQTIQDIRRYIFNLQGGLPPSDLVSGLEELLRDFRINTLLETRLTVSGEEREALGAEQRQHILQIAREALANVARHAHARRVDVRLTYDTRTLQLQIADDGVGLAMTPTATGQGLRNIRERARLLDGTLDIDSAPGQGVTITLTVPLKGET